ncbi:MAG: putative metalloprotease CJM1_0395 family protein [Pseudomonadota bacterium]
MTQSALVQPLLAQQVRLDPSARGDAPLATRKVDATRDTQAPTQRGVPESPPETSAAAVRVLPFDRQPSAIGAEGVRNLLASEVDDQTSPIQAESGADGLSEAERQLVEQLKARDREVKDHEEAHARVGGQYASEPSYDYQVGPDGQNYAIGGSVQIDVSPVKDDPRATIAKMEIVKAAALAPAEPSPADRRVASLADAQRLAAIAELNAQRAERREDLADVDLGTLVGELFRQTDSPAEPQLSIAA